MWSCVESSGDRTLASQVGFAHRVARCSIGKAVSTVDISECNAGHEQPGFYAGLLFDERIDSVLGRGHSVLRILEKEV